jgi:hypothetical protein
MGFYLPQSRPRVYGIFLRLDNPSSCHTKRRQEDLAKAWALLTRLQVPGPPEPLSTIMQRCAETVAHCGHQSTATRWLKVGVSSCGSQEAMAPGAKWKAQHAAWALKKGITNADLQDGYEAFKQAAGTVLNDRQREALWLKLVLLRKTKAVQWQDELLVATVGASINFLSVRQDLFPCVTPHMPYAILQNGQISLAHGITILAMQGIQLKEFHNFAFGREKDSLLRDLGGNAFTANIIGAFMIAGLSFM